MSDSNTCLFCDLVANRDREIIAENELFLAVFDNFPVTKGHTLIIPKAHVSDFFQLRRDQELVLLGRLIKGVKHVLDARYTPAAYNIGINCGAAAGQTVFHLHVHVFPRYQGDVENPRGGIRNFKQALVEYK